RRRGRGHRPAGAGGAMTGGLVTQQDVAGGLSLEGGGVIVGAGGGGGAAGRGLAGGGGGGGLVEGGGGPPPRGCATRDGRALRTLYRDAGGGMAVGRPSVLYTEGRCVGGSTVVNGGMSWRTPDRVLRRWAEQEGLREFGERDLDPYFTAIESRLSVGLQDPETIGRDSELFRAGAQARGWAVVPNRRNQLHCAGTSNCSNGCPT